MSLPEYIDDEETLDEVMTRPADATVELMKALEGDIMILGINGKMGLTLGRLAVRAIEKAGVTKRVIGVSRFSTPGGREKLEEWGIETLQCDLLDRASVAKLPDIPNLIFMAGRKFGTDGSPEFTWAMNTLVPSHVCEAFPDSRVVAFSSGNIYPFTPVESGGATEATRPSPIGDYAQSCLGREMIFTFHSHSIPVLLYRLNYAVDLRYGVLYDLASTILAGDPVDVSMGYVNFIWQGDANNHAIRCLDLCASPARPLNITGPGTHTLRDLATKLGKHLGIEPNFSGTEAETALLNNAAESIKLFGAPSVDSDTLLRWTARWVKAGGASLGKPTHFQERTGKF